MSITKLLLLTSCGLVLSGCANFKSIHRKGVINPGGQTEFVDAKQRAVLVNPVYTPAVEEHKQDIQDRIKMRRKRSYGSGSNDNANKPITFNIDSKVYERGASNSIEITSHPKFRMCSEAAPDVFSAYAFSAAAEAAAESNGTDKKASGMFGLSSAETAATIERTQTINMLRESMFRTCERWMNGALSERQMNIQTARDQRMMVATLAIEQLTGVVKRQPTILTSAAVSSLGENTTELIKELKKVQEETKAAQIAYDGAETTFKAKETAYKKLNAKPTKLPDSLKGKKFCAIAKAGDAATDLEKQLLRDSKKKTDCDTANKAEDEAITAITNANNNNNLLPDKQNEAIKNYKTKNVEVSKPTTDTKGACDILRNDPEGAIVDEKLALKVAKKDECELLFKLREEAKSAHTHAKESLKAAQNKKTVADTLLEAADGDVKLPTNLKGACDVLTDPKPSAADIQLVGDKPTKAECETASTAKIKADSDKTNAQTELNKKKENEKRVEAMVEKAAGIYTAAVGTGTGDTGNDPNSAARMAVVVGTIDRITERAFSDQSEIVFSCMQDMRIDGIDDGYRAACLKMVQQQFDTNNLKSLANTSAFSTSTLLQSYGLSSAETAVLLAESSNRHDEAAKIAPQLVSCITDKVKTGKFSDAVLVKLKRNGFDTLPIIADKKLEEFSRKLRTSSSLGDLLVDACK